MQYRNTNSNNLEQIAGTGTGSGTFGRLFVRPLARSDFNSHTTLTNLTRLGVFT